MEGLPHAEFKQTDLGNIENDSDASDGGTYTVGFFEFCFYVCLCGFVCRKLAMDMESTKAALESERKIQMLQMQAINALWKKVSTIQPPAKIENANNNTQTVSTTSTTTTTSTVDNSEVVKDLAQTCSMLNAQVFI